MLIAGRAAIVEIDIKKIIALSTLSQLGVIMLTLGIGSLTVAFFHIVSHAFFKALLFITVGAIIHISNDYQDLRKINLLPSQLPLTLSFNLAANIRLCGLPFLRGFYSKDLCIEIEISQRIRLPISFMFYLATGLTAAYTARFFKIILLPFSKTGSSNWLRDKDWYTNISIIVLFILRVLGRSSLS